MPEEEFLERVRFCGKPVADPTSIVVAENARFTLLTSRLVRMEWSPGGKFDDRSTYAFPTRLAPVPFFGVARSDTLLTIDTEALTLRYHLGHRFEPGSLAAVLRGAASTDTPSHEGPNESPHGWHPGRVGLDNLRGTRRTLDACEGDASLEEGFLSRGGWALFDDSRSVRFDPISGWVSPSPEPPYLDWYLFAYGHDYKGALEDYTTFGGPIPLIPRYVLGAWWSRYWAYSDRDLKRLIREFERHRFPLDVLVIDVDWHTPHAWTGYTWNRELFPDPPAFLKWVHDKGLRATLNLHPAQGVQAFEEAYPDFARSLGHDSAGGQAIPFQIGDPAFAKSYFELLHHPLEEQGVDFWWVDWQQGEASEMRGLDPLPWLNHLHFNDSKRRAGRPMLYSRWGGLGNHRYPIGFSGDTYVTWEALQFQPYLTATAANVGYGWWSHDIGGHMGGATEPELFARWVQFGALSPVLRLHATKDARAERRPWAYPRSVCRAARSAFLLRYQLVPYLYTMARVAADSGLSLCRPMYYEHPEEEAAYFARGQYYLGDQMIAAPIVHPADPDTRLASTDVWLPPGTWIDFSTLESFSGPGWVRIVGGMARIPLLVRAGGIVALAGAFPIEAAPRLSSGTTGALRGDTIALAIFPGQEGAFRLYEDDGASERYRDGQYEWTPITSRMISSGCWEVGIGAVEGTCDDLPRLRDIEVRLVGSLPPESLLVDGRPHSNWTYDSQAVTTTIRIHQHDRRTRVAITASSSAGMSALGEGHNLRLVRDDVRRLLHLRRSRRLDGASRADLLDMALRTACPGQADAIARLGGPLFRVLGHGEIERARVSLGEVIVATPRLAQESLEVDTHFRIEPPLDTVGGSHGSAHTSRAAIGDIVLKAPAAPLCPIRTARWHADVALKWRGVTISGHHTSPPLFPAVYAWQGAVMVDEDPQAAEWDAVIDRDGLPRAGLAWANLSQSEEDLVNVYQPHIVNLSEQFGIEPGAGHLPVAYLATVINSPSARPAILQLRCPGPLDLRLGGRPVALEPGEYEGLIHPRLRPTRRTETVRLAAGDNHLVARCRPARDGRRWLLGIAITSPEGEVMLDLVYRLIHVS